MPERNQQIRHLENQFQTPPDPEVDLEETDLEEDSGECPLFTDPSLQQSITRLVDDSGDEQILAYFRVPVANQQKVASVHMPFWPALADRPTVMAQVLSEFGGKCKVVRSERFGVKIDVSLNSHDKQTSIVIEIIVSCHSSHNQEESTKRNAA